MTETTTETEPPVINGRGWAVVSLLVMTAVTGLGVLAHIYLGSFTRFMADSYCHAALATRLGVFGMIANLYQGWSGRFSASLLEGVMGGVIGPGIAPWWSPVLLLTWLAALAMMVNAVSQGVAARYRRWVAGLLALLILYVTLDNTPNVGQSAYWTTGLNNYAVPLILFTFFVAFTALGAHRALTARTAWVWLLLSMALNGFIGGFNETLVVVQCTALALAMGLIWLFGAADLKQNVLPVLAAGLIGAGLALVVVAVAPGNKVRQSFSPPPPDLVTLGLYTLKFTKEVVLATLAKEPLNVIGLPAVAALVGANLARPDGWLFGSTRTVLRTVLWTPVITLALVAAAVMPAAYATSAIPNERNMLIVMYFLTIGLTVWGYAVGQWYRQVGANELQTPLERYGLTLALGAVLALFAINTLRTAQVTFDLRGQYATYARGWDHDQTLILTARQAGATEVTVAPISNALGIEEIKPDPNDWVNNCVSNYYGLTVKTEAPSQ